MTHQARPEELIAALVIPLIESPADTARIFLSAIGDVEFYRDGVVPSQELWEDNEAGIEYELRYIGGLAIPQRLRDYPHALGRRRAEQGVSLTALNRAIRSGFSVLWKSILSQHAILDGSHVVDLTLLAWDRHEEYALKVEEAFLGQMSRAQNLDDVVREHLMNRLIATDGLDGSVVRLVAGALGVESGAAFLAVTATRGAEIDVEMLEQKLRSYHVAVQRVRTGQLETVVFCFESKLVSLINSWLAVIACGVSPVARGVAAIPKAVRVSTAIADARAEPGAAVSTLVDAWPEIIASQLHELATEVRTLVLSKVDGLSDRERTLLLQTVRRYASSGSVAAVAEELYCHRNTVQNRLAKFAELTGLDVTVPEDFATIHFALKVDAVQRAAR